MKKISARVARKLYETNQTFVMTPGNFRPDSWAACIISGEGYNEEGFDILCRDFRRYNSIISERISFWSVA